MWSQWPAFGNRANQEQLRAIPGKVWLAKIEAIAKADEVEGIVSRSPNPGLKEPPRLSDTSTMKIL
jgi:hypothetical protein